MRTCLVVLSWLMIASCYALKVISIENPTVNASPSYFNTMPVGVDDDASLVLEMSKDLRLPVTSHIHAGVVLRHRVAGGFVLSQPVFVVGDDAVSRAWLREQASNLQALNALGFVTNVINADRLHELETLAGMPMQPVDVDAFSELLQVKHYPYLFNEGVVWQ